MKVTMEAQVCLYFLGLLILLVDIIAYVDRRTGEDYREARGEIVFV